MTVLLRPEAAKLIDGNYDFKHGETAISGMVTERTFKGGHFKLTIQTDTGPTLNFDFAHDARSPAAGQSVRLVLRPSAVVLIPPD